MQKLKKKPEFSNFLISIKNEFFQKRSLKIPINIIRVFLKVYIFLIVIIVELSLLFCILKWHSLKKKYVIT